MMSINKLLCGSVICMSLIAPVCAMDSINRRVAFSGTGDTLKEIATAVNRTRRFISGVEQHPDDVDVCRLIGRLAGLKTELDDAISRVARVVTPAIANDILAHALVFPDSAGAAEDDDLVLDPQLIKIALQHGADRAPAIAFIRRGLTEEGTPNVVELSNDMVLDLFLGLMTESDEGLQAAIGHAEATENSRLWSEIFALLRSE